VAQLPGIGKKTQQVLAKLGVGTIGQLAALPSDVLESHFGTYGVVIHEHANGIDNRKVEHPGEAMSISRETTFGTDTGDRQLLLATLRYLSEKVGGALRRQGKRARCVNIKLRYADFTTITRQQTLDRSSDSDQTVFDAGRKLMNKELSSGKQAVRLIGIGVSSLVREKQLGMLDTSDMRLEKLNKAIDRIREKYGFTAIQTGRTLLLKDIFPPNKGGYTLTTPSLSR